MYKLLFLSLLLNQAEAKKNKGGDSSDVPTENNDKLGDVPNDATSKKYAKQLLSTKINNFSPDAEGLSYKTLQFNGDNTWSANAMVSVMDEEMECSESGTWTMDPASSETIANMNWIISSTDCPTRQAPQNLRVEVTLVTSESGIHVNFR